MENWRCNTGHVIWGKRRTKCELDAPLGLLTPSDMRRRKRMGYAMWGYAIPKYAIRSRRYGIRDVVMSYGVCDKREIREARYVIQDM